MQEYVFKPLNKVLFIKTKTPEMSGSDVLVVKVRHTV